MTKATSARGPSPSVASVLLSSADRYASRPLAAIVIVVVAGTWVSQAAVDDEAVSPIRPPA